MYEKRSGITPEGDGQYVVEEYGNGYNLIVLNADASDDETYECKTISSFAFAEVILMGNVNIFTES